MKHAAHDLEVMGSNPSQVELGVHSTSVLVVLEPKILCLEECHAERAKSVLRTVHEVWSAIYMSGQLGKGGWGVEGGGRHRVREVVSIKR